MIDAPQFIPAKITVLATQSAGALMSFVLFLYYRWANARKDKKASQVAGGEMGQWDNLTDKENPTFRYVY